MFIYLNTSPERVLLEGLRATRNPGEQCENKGCAVWGAAEPSTLDP